MLSGIMSIKTHEHMQVWSSFTQSLPRVVLLFFGDVCCWRRKPEEQSSPADFACLACFGFTAQRNCITNCVTRTRKRRKAFSWYLSPVMEIADGGPAELTKTSQPCKRGKGNLVDWRIKSRRSKRVIENERQVPASVKPDVSVNVCARAFACRCCVCT